MCLFSSPSKPAPKAPPPARAPASLDMSTLEQTPSGARKRRARGKRGMRSSGSTGLGVGGSNSSSLNIPKGGNK